MSSDLASCRVCFNRRKFLATAACAAGAWCLRESWALAAKVAGDVERLLSQWDVWGWHRVTFYGDHKRAVQQFSALSGFKVIEEA